MNRYKTKQLCCSERCIILYLNMYRNACPRLVKTFFELTMRCGLVSAGSSGRSRYGMHWGYGKPWKRSSQKKNVCQGKKAAELDGSRRCWPLAASRFTRSSEAFDTI